MNTTHSHTSRRTTRRLAAIGFAAAALLAACGDDDDASTTATDAPAASEAAAAPATTSDTEVIANEELDYADGYGDDSAETTEPATTETDAATEALPGLAVVATAETDLGTVLVDADGLTLYGFLNDTAGEPTCVEQCADAWPPAFADEVGELEGLDASVFSIVEHPGGSQLKAGDWPLYTFAGDAAPGDVTGQGSGGVWFVVAPDGSLISGD